MADRADRAIIGGEALDQRHAVLVLGQIPERPVTPGIEYRIKAVGGYARKYFCICESLLGRLVGLEPPGVIGLRIIGIARRIKRRLPALGRSQRDLRPGILEHIIRRGKFLEPEAGLLAGVAQLVVRCQNHKNVHWNAFFCCGGIVFLLINAPRALWLRGGGDRKRAQTFSLKGEGYEALPIKPWRRRTGAVG